MPGLAEQATGRELAVLGDGPFRLRWYWRDDLEAMQRASRRHPDGHPAARMRGYAPTERHQPHPLERGVTGRVWRYQAPREPAPESGAAADDAEAPTT